MLLQTRRLILGTYFAVESAGRISEAASILSKRDFEIIVLCDTLSEEECRQIAEIVRDQYPKPKLLSLLGPGNEGRDQLIGRKVPKGKGPLDLLRVCADALGYEIGGRQPRNLPN